MRPFWRALVLVLLVVTVGLLTEAPTVHAFRDHRAIVTTALQGQMDAQALTWVITASEVQDKPAGQLHNENHFDNARNATAICRLWNQGVKVWSGEVVQNSAPRGTDKRDLNDRKAALEAFGRVAHAVEDFYAHSNMVEISVERAFQPDPKLLIGDSCDPSAFPPGIQTGFFDSGTWLRQRLRHPTDPNAATGCPDTGPPAGFEFCHYGPRGVDTDGLNKDSAQSPEGTRIDSQGQSYFALAQQLAIDATRAAWDAVHTRIVRKYEADKSTDAECLFTKLAWGRDGTCRKL